MLMDTHTKQFSGIDRAAKFRALSIPTWSKLSQSEYLQTDKQLNLHRHIKLRIPNLMHSTTPTRHTFNIQQKMLH